jgi:hypothetical protein
MMPRLRRCQYFARPDADWSAEADEVSYEARLGLAFHEVAPYVLAGSEGLTDDAFDDIAAKWNVDRDELAEYRDSLLKACGDGLEAELFAGKKWRAEVAYAYNVKTSAARRLQVEGHRQYPELEDDEIALTVDAASDTLKDYVVILDWKTGSFRYLEPPRHNLQMGLSALAAARAADVDTVVVYIVRVTPEDVKVEKVVFRELDFDAIADEIRALVKYIPGSEPCPGEWCSFCPARGACPAAVSAMTEIIPTAEDLPDTFRLIGPIQSLAEAQYRLALWPLVKDAKERYHADLKAFADKHNGIVTADGTRLWRRFKKACADFELNDAAVAYLRETLGEFADDVALEERYPFATSKGAIVKAAKKTVKAGDKKATAKDGEAFAEEIFAELKKLAAMVDKPQVAYDYIKIDKGK